jgi:two-component system chemotaxis response regulator CheY
MFNKILVVDDSPLIHRMFDVMIRQLKCETVNAMNGQEALDALSTHKGIRVILLDLNMPVMNGIQFLEKAASLGITKKIPVILVCSEDKEQVVRGLRMGAKGFMQKSFNPFEFTSLIGKFIPETLAHA